MMSIWVSPRSASPATLRRPVPLPDGPGRQAIERSRHEPRHAVTARAFSSSIGRDRITSREGAPDPPRPESYTWRASRPFPSYSTARGDFPHGDRRQFPRLMTISGTVARGSNGPQSAFQPPGTPLAPAPAPREPPPTDRGMRRAAATARRFCRGQSHPGGPRTGIAPRTHRHFVRSYDRNEPAHPFYFLEGFDLENQ